MKKKLIVIISAIALIAVLVVVGIGVLTPTLDAGQPTAFWDRTEGSYQLDYSIVGDDSTMSAMVAKYLTDPVVVHFDGEQVTLVVALNINVDTDSMLRVMVDEQYIDSTKCLVQSQGEVSVFELTTTKASLTDTLTFKLKAGAMPFEPEFSVWMDVDNATFASNYECC